MGGQEKVKGGRKWDLWTIDVPLLGDGDGMWTNYKEQGWTLPAAGKCTLCMRVYIVLPMYLQCVASSVFLLFLVGAVLSGGVTRRGQLTMFVLNLSEPKKQPPDWEAKSPGAGDKAGINSCRKEFLSGILRKHFHFKPCWPFTRSPAPIIYLWSQSL